MKTVIPFTAPMPVVERTLVRLLREKARQLRHPLRWRHRPAKKGTRRPS